MVPAVAETAVYNVWRSPKQKCSTRLASQTKEEMKWGLTYSSVRKLLEILKLFPLLSREVHERIRKSTKIEQSNNHISRIETCYNVSL
mmetsp:Transcript_108801/g.221953  ORF Transcript_108801/g.221953 Transcript_108801/m.221953 type:complete len:88 (-) Transcript_108801:92-355(-)